LLAAVLISQIAHYFLYALFRRLSLRRHSIVAQEIINHTQQVSRLLFLLLAVSMVFPRFDIPDCLVEPGEHGLEIGYIIVVVWLAIAVIEVFNALVSHNLPQDLADNVRARRRHTLTEISLIPSSCDPLVHRVSKRSKHRPRFSRPFAPCFASWDMVHPVYLLTRSGSLGLRQAHSPKQIGVPGIGTQPVPSHVARKINHASRMLLVAPFE
jgi:hypothetical protein